MEEIILQSIAKKVEEGDRAALITLIHSEGSTPRKNGSIMAVYEDGSIYGSIGGGSVEAEAIKYTLDCIKTGESKMFELELNESGSLGMVCGGNVKGYIKVFLPKDKLVIVGGGHIGQSLSKIASNLNFNTIVLEDREEYKKHEAFKDSTVLIGTLEESIKNIKINNNTYIVVVTRGHLLDNEAVNLIIDKPFKYLGVIGSKRKIIDMHNKLRNKGVTQEKIDKIYGPIGIDIADGTPGEIAISILAEMLKVKNSGKLEHMKLKEE